MNKTLTYFISAALMTFSVMAKDACPEGTTAFVCTNPAGKVKLNRCATGNTCYDKQDDKQTLRCCPVKETTNNTKKTFLNLVKAGNNTALDEFKASCNYSSPIDFAADVEIQEATKAALASASLELVRGLIFATANCADVASGEQAKRWLGNDVLVQRPVRLIHALSYEEAETKIYGMSNLHKDEWAGTECQDSVCANERKEYFAKKHDALTKAKVPESMESIRNGLLRALTRSH